MPWAATPNSAACFIVVALSPAVLIASTLAPEDCACRIADEKSAVPSGVFAPPTTLPPSSAMRARAVASTALPKA